MWWHFFSWNAAILPGSVQYLSSCFHQDDFFITALGSHQKLVHFGMMHITGCLQYIELEVQTILVDDMVNAAAISTVQMLKYLK